MAYATFADLEELWGADFIQDLLPEDVDAAEAVAKGLETASSEVDLYLSARYTLPLPSSPAVLVPPTCDIAVYKLANRHSALTETITDRYKFARELLARIADGKAGLGVDEPRISSGDGDTSASGAAFEANPRLFSRRTLP